MINGQKHFDDLVKKNNNNIAKKDRKIATG